MEQNNKNKEAIDVSGMLEESDSGPKFPRGQPSPYPFQSKIIQWIIKYSGGLIKNPKQANYVLLGLIVLIVIISLFLIFGGGGRIEREEIFTPPAEAPVEEVIPPAQF